MKGLALALFFAFGAPMSARAEECLGLLECFQNGVGVRTERQKLAETQLQRNARRLAARYSAALDRQSEAYESPRRFYFRVHRGLHGSADGVVIGPLTLYEDEARDLLTLDRKMRALVDRSLLPELRLNLDELAARRQVAFARDEAGEGAEEIFRFRFSVVDDGQPTGYLEAKPDEVFFRGLLEAELQKALAARRVHANAAWSSR